MVTWIPKLSEMRIETCACADCCEYNLILRRKYFSITAASCTLDAYELKRCHYTSSAAISNIASERIPSACRWAHLDRDRPSIGPRQYSSDLGSSNYELQSLQFYTLAGAQSSLKVAMLLFQRRGERCASWYIYCKIGVLIPRGKCATRHFFAPDANKRVLIYEHDAARALSTHLEMKRI